MGSVLSAVYCRFDSSFCRYCAAETPSASHRSAVEIKLSVFLDKPWCQAGAERSNYKPGLPRCLCDPAKDGWASNSPCRGSPGIFSLPEPTSDCKYALSSLEVIFSLLGQESVRSELFAQKINVSFDIPWDKRQPKGG